MMQLDRHNKRPMLIGGELGESAGGGWIESVNPATEEVIGYVPPRYRLRSTSQNGRRSR
jgi:hypothetical protein